MITVQINPQTQAGKRILKEIAANPKIGSIKNPLVPRDENGNVIGCSVDYYCDQLEKMVMAKFDALDEKA